MARPTKTQPARLTDEPVNAAPARPNKEASKHADERATEKGHSRQTEAEADLDPALIFLGNAVLKARRDMGLTQLELAKKANCASSAIFMVEAARQNMTIKSLLLIAAALNVQIGDLLPRTEQQLPAKLKELAEVLIDSSGRLATHLRTVDRAIAELSKEN